MTALVAIAGVLAVVAVRHKPKPPAGSAAPSFAVLAVQGSSALRWTGSPTCGTNEPATTSAQVSSDSGATWQPVTVPLSGVSTLSFGTPGDAIAAGYDQRCNPTDAVTTDGGQTWSAAKVQPPLAAASYGPGGGLWGIGGGGVVRGAADADTLAAAGNSCAGDYPGPASLISALSPTTAYVVCQNEAGAGRLVSQTTNSGNDWIYDTDDRVSQGLYGGQTVSSFSMTSMTVGHLLVAGSGRCSSGDIRTTVDDGVHWTPLPCVSGVTNVLAVAFTDAQHGLLIGTQSGRVVTLSTDNDGTTWSTIGQ